MSDIFALFLHVIVTVIRLMKPSGLRSVVAESTLVRDQLLILNRSRKRAPNLRVSDRMIAGLCTLLMRPARVLRSAIVLKPSTLVHFHHMLIKRKYRLLFSSKGRRRPGPKGPEKELIDAVVEMKRRNPTWGCPRIAEQITLAFGVDIDKDVVRRILGMHNRPESGSGGPSWLTFLGNAKDSLWSMDLFRRESLRLRTHWVLVVMDQFTRCNRSILGRPRAPHFTAQPGSSKVPIPDHRIRRHSQYLGGFLHTQSAEKSHFENSALALIGFCQTLQSEIHGYDLFNLFGREDDSGIYRNVNGSAPAFHTSPSASVIHKHMAHDLGSCSKKMSAVTPPRIGAWQKAKERLLH